MKNVIIYASTHHGNTKKIVDAIASNYDVDIIDATQQREADLSNYDAIGFASGIYFSKFHQSVLNFASINTPSQKKVFFICTFGGSAVFKSIEEVLAGKQTTTIGKFSCKGFDTYGPFKLIGGVAKGHPDDEDIVNAIEFYKGLV